MPGAPAILGHSDLLNATVVTLRLGIQMTKCV